MNVLVTGAAGYLGSVLCEHLLDAGHRVIGVDNLQYGQTGPLQLAAHPEFDFIRGDARDEGLLAPMVRRADVIVPLAALVGAPACDRDRGAAVSVNLEAVRLLNRLRGQGQLVVFPTTNSGYGTKSGDIHCTEDTPLEPISLYGETKVQAEAELLETGTAITLRLATVFGMSSRMRLDLLVNHFVHAALTDSHIVIFEKDFKRNFIHIRDVADCFVHAISNADSMAGQAFNAGLDEANLSKEELALKIQALVPRFYIHFAEIGSDPDKRNYIVSNKRLSQAGFVARRPLDDGIRELIKGFGMLPRSRYANA